jgi:hypothetical protein
VFAGLTTEAYFSTFCCDIPKNLAFLGSLMKTPAKTLRGSPKMTRATIPLVVLILIADLACAPATIRTESQSITDPALPHEATVHRALWGHLPVGGDYIVRDCSSYSLQRVSYHLNWWQAIATVGTLGIYCPVTVRYLCAKEESPESFVDMIMIKPLIIEPDTLTMLTVGYIEQTRSAWEWPAWLSDSHGTPKRFYVVGATPETVCKTMEDSNHQIEYTIGFMYEADSVNVQRDTE